MGQAPLLLLLNAARLDTVRQFSFHPQPFAVLLFAMP